MSSTSTTSESTDPPPAPSFIPSEIKAKKIELTKFADEKITAIKILVIDTANHNWYNIFKNIKTTIPVIIEQTTWPNIRCSVRNDRLVVDMEKEGNPIPMTTQGKPRSFSPHICLVRNVVREPEIAKDFRNAFFAFKSAGIPMVNTSESIYSCFERVWVHASLKSLQSKHGNERFPLVDQEYYSSYNSLRETSFVPSSVMKIGPSHAGFGKGLFKTADDRVSYDDFCSLVAMTDLYITREPFVPNICDIRVQRITNPDWVLQNLKDPCSNSEPPAKYRIYKKKAVHGWKGNRNSQGRLIEGPIEPRFQFIVDEAASLFGGLDICAIDLLELEGGSIVILELNDTAIGLGKSPVLEEDMTQMAKLTLSRTQEHYNLPQMY